MEKADIRERERLARAGGTTTGKERNGIKKKMKKRWT
jgi:hypothetical protein